MRLIFLVPLLCVNYLGFFFRKRQKNIRRGRKSSRGLRSISKNIGAKNAMKLDLQDRLGIRVTTMFLLKPSLDSPLG